MIAEESSPPDSSTPSPRSSSTTATAVPATAGAFGHPDRIARIHRLQLPFGVSATATAAVAASYAATIELEARIRHIGAERDRLHTALRAFGIAVPRSHANFLYLPGSGMATALRRAGIAAKCYPDGSARIAVGDPAAGRAVLAATT